MASGRGKDVVLATALVAALLHGGLLVLRARGVIGTQWTDGRHWLAADAGDLRREVWDEPAVLDDLGCAARDPALAPDGRMPVLVVGERGRNAELYASPLVAGVPGLATPLASLNTTADELAPA